MSLDLTQLLNLIEEMPVYRQLIKALQQDGETRAVMLEAAKPYLIAALYRSRRLPMLVVTAQPENCKRLYEQLSIWSNSEVKLFPEPDALPYERIVPDAATELERVQVLSAMANCNQNEPTADAPLVVTSASVLMGKITSYSDFASTCHIARPGMEIEPFDLLRRWETMGYRMESVVEMPGIISHRGGIIDIYPPTSELPARLEFFGNTVDSIRLFDPVSQRSLRAVSSINISPVTELLAPLLSSRMELERVLNGIDLSGCNPEVGQQFRQEIVMMLDGERPRDTQFYASLFNEDSLLNYLPRNALLVLDEPQNIEQAMAELEAEAEQMRLEKLERGELPRNFPRPYFTWKELEAVIKNRQGLMLTAWEAEGESYRLNFAPAPGYAGQLPSFIKKTKRLLDQKRRLIFVSHQASRLSELLNEEDIIAAPLTEIKQMPAPGSLTLVQGSLVEGWVMNNDTCLLTDAEIFGFIKERRLIKRRPVPHHKLLIDITPGDYVVHVEHGIARFNGVTTLSTNGSQKEYLVLQYAAGDRLYVPTDQIDRVNRYIGAGDRPPSLSRLGTQEWTRTKQRAKEAAEDLAQELLALYATREVVPGFAFACDTLWQQELEASFPYVETPDQLEAQTQVKGDMEKTKPMDRLVCGDVGYGKTELAMRAAFKVAEAGRQVAVLVPTTVLADQHYRTFSERFADYPFEIDVISRFRTAGEQTKLLKRLVLGKLDILIGTHRMLSDDVRFANLALVVIDEEQRFGVEHKERLKTMRASVDVMTLTATPIPRTLHMALLGLRDISSLTTPPMDRRSIHTEVCQYDPSLIRWAIQRELTRGGQVFFVHNRVGNIQAVAERVRGLAPDARVDVGHGQMHSHEMERAMLRFVAHETDVLVCTTIIESGLDIPSANTMIICDCDRFGLAALHQLRGRVGRYKHRAYCYMLLGENRTISPIAAKRLKAIEEFSDLGAGFQIAMRDLEIRGAGNILGQEQSGHIAAVGYELYCQLLEGAVSDLRGESKTAAPAQPAHIELGIGTYIPRAYIPSQRQRMEAYRRLGRCDLSKDLQQVRSDFSDVYGPVPAEVEELLDMTEARALAGRAGIKSIVLIKSDIVFTVNDLVAAQRVFDGASGTVRMPDDHTVHWRLGPPYLQMPTLLRILLKQLRQAAGEV